MSGARGFGVAAGLEPALASALARRCSELGYGSIWSNDNPAASGLRTLAAFADGCETIELGVGVIALDRHSPAEIEAEIKALGLDRERLWIGVGSGHAERPLTAMRDAVAELRETLGGVRLMLAAMGPRMCELAGSAYDGVLFNWMTPEFAAVARGHVEAGALQAGRPTPPIFGYVRAAVGADAETRLAKAEGFYRDLHKGYRDHFARLAQPPGEVGVHSERAEEIGPALEAYEALDTVVVRGLADARLKTLDRIATAAAPRP